MRATLQKPKVAELIKPYRVGHLVNQIKKLAEAIGPLPRVERSPDPTDDFLLALSVAGKAYYLVTGDKSGLRMNVVKAPSSKTAKGVGIIPTKCRGCRSPTIRRKLNSSAAWPPARSASPAIFVKNSPRTAWSWATFLSPAVRAPSSGHRSPISGPAIGSTASEGCTADDDPVAVVFKFDGERAVFITVWKVK